eukprot:CAMPEP_0197624722 /NCGR_PEP_ID=MMETSP1338-20131121/4268_1 /TAXON_ID=43686 ORGANISM="Pelagodinium beii, Strain RCC1491" /NCGR_SAMPLE_ID=MMETSP1338 /ASSEMBLY_ACC=CAM_ASM_000754 /LENGTH=563 /DNA_ID=CAMNT_0043194917 /DNA_START=50 /DNA_END=1737 /DNA_ORIENTATION=+
MEESDAEDELTSFLDDVDKEIITEAPPEAWYQPKAGDVLEVEVERCRSEGGEDRKLHKWTLGSPAPVTIPGLDVDRCVRTMRCGETAFLRSKKEVKAAATLRLLSLERNEDILGDGRLMRRTLREGRGWKTPKAPCEVLLRFSWQALASGDKIPETGQAAKEVAMSIKNGSCTGSADWIPGIYGLRVLTDLRVGQRCLVQLSSELLSGSPIERPPGSGPLEYDIELLQIFTFEDISLDRSEKIMKKVTREGDGYSKPVEGATVKLRIQVDGAEREISAEAASGRFCAALEEAVLSMKKHEICEVRCSDPEACRDEELAFGPGLLVVFLLELLDFEELDVFSSAENQRVEYCSRRKEVGSFFFQKSSWRQALKRYQVVTSNLGYLHSWKNEASKAQAMSLRKACHLNIAACWLKLEEWLEASKACDAVLTDEPHNVKALFRRGQSLKELKEFREAEKCFRKVLAVQADNKEATRMLVQLRQMVKSEVEQQKEMFSRMARGIADTENEATELPPGNDKPLEAETRSSLPDSNSSQLEVKDDALEEEEDDGTLTLMGISALLACAA